MQANLHYMREINMQVQELKKFQDPKDNPNLAKEH